MLYKLTQVTKNLGHAVWGSGTAYIQKWTEQKKKGTTEKKPSCRRTICRRQFVVFGANRFSKRMMLFFSVLLVIGTWSIFTNSPNFWWWNLTSPKLVYLGLKTSLTPNFTIKWLKINIGMKIPSVSNFTSEFYAANCQLQKKYLIHGNCYLFVIKFPIWIATKMWN